MVFSILIAFRRLSIRYRTNSESPLALTVSTLYAKRFWSYNFTKTLKTLQTFHGNRWMPSAGTKMEDAKKEEINCQLVKIILIMLILFLPHYSWSAICLWWGRTNLLQEKTCFRTTYQYGYVECLQKKDLKISPSE